MTRQPILRPSFRFRQPEYTGANRCLPCTVVNVALAAVITGPVSLLSPTAATVVGVVSLASIYFRGYLVPGTPELTKRYLPERVLRWFGNHAEPRETSDVDPGVLLSAADVIVNSPGGTDVAVTDAFARTWRTRVGELRESGQAVQSLAGLLDLPDAAITVVPDGTGVTASMGRERLGVWESETALLADIAAMELLAERVPNWAHLSVEARSDTTAALRLLSDRCPGCGGQTVLEQRTVDSCCASYPVAAVTCHGCSVTIVEVRLSDRLLIGASDSESQV